MYLYPGYRFTVQYTATSTSTTLECTHVNNVAVVFLKIFNNKSNIGALNAKCKEVWMFTSNY